MLFDVLGTLYLAYDLLGRRKGPLRPLTELVSVAAAMFATAGLGALAVITAAGLLQLRILSVLGYQATLGAALGLSFGSIPGIVISYGTILAKLRNNPYQGIKQIKYWRKPLEAMPLSVALGLEVGLTIFLGMVFAHDLVTGLVAGAVGGFFGGLIIGRLTGLVLIRNLPAEGDPEPPLFDRMAPVLAVTALTPAGLITAVAYWIVYGPRDAMSLIVALSVGVLAAVVGGLVGGAGMGLAQRLDWWVGHLPERRLGAYGVGLIFAGFVLLSVQYWLLELDIRVR